KAPGGDVPSDLPFRTAAAFAAAAPASVDWIAEPWAAAGALTAITGRPKIGKTTFLLDLVAAVLQGEPFLNYPASTSLRHLPSPLEGEQERRIL
ncbi:MAG TPA: AAA family ATPase, partial [Dehalococcoidia bacterium]|nr:AAA family ATPase [Dehalococcoidia bacterium]